MAKGKDSSWKNVYDWAKGKARLEHGILQHPDEDSGDKSVFNYMKSHTNKDKKLHILPFKQFEKLGKNEKG